MQGGNTVFAVVSLLVVVLSVSLWMPLLVGLRKPETQRASWLARCFKVSSFAGAGFCALVALWVKFSFQTAGNPGLAGDQRNMLLACALFGAISLLNAALASAMAARLRSPSQ